MRDGAETVGLFRMAAAFAGIRKSCAEWKFRALKAENELEELRMRLHQAGMPDAKVRADALNYLKAEAEDYHRRLEEHPF